jgi:hypothetical protein
MQSESSINIKPIIQPAQGNYIFEIDVSPSSGNVSWSDSQQAFVFTLNAVPCALQSSDQFLFVVSDVYGQPASYAAVTIYCSAG